MVLHWTLSLSFIQFFFKFLGKSEAQHSYNLFYKKCISMYEGMLVVAVTK